MMKSLVANAKQIGIGLILGIVAMLVYSYGTSPCAFGSSECPVGATIVANQDIGLKGGTAYTLTITGVPTADRTITLPNVTDTVAVLGTAQTFSATNTFSSVTSIIFSHADGGTLTASSATGILTLRGQKTAANTGTAIEIKTLNAADENTSRLTITGGVNTAVWTFANSTIAGASLTSPTITTSPTAAGATWTNLGTVTTADINGGTVDSLTALSIRSTGAAYDLTLATTSVFTQGRTLTIVPGDAARTITLSGNPTLADWFDQAVKAGSSPTFATLTINRDTDNTITVAVAKASTPANQLLFQTSRGSVASPTNLPGGAVIGQIDWQGRITGWDAQARILIQHTTGTTAGTRMIFSTSIDGGSLTEAARFSNTQQFILGKGELGTTLATGNTLRAPNITTGGAGNIAGASLTFSSGLGIGTGAPGSVILSSTLAAATGDNIQTASANTLVANQGNVGIGQSPTGTTGTAGLIFADATALSAVPANTAGLFANDVAGTTEMFAIDEAGNTAQLTPHPADFLASLAKSYTYPWSYSASNSYLGVKVDVDMEGLVRAVEQLTGKKFLYVTQIPKGDWCTAEQVKKQATDSQRATAQAKVDAESNAIKRAELQAQVPQAYAIQAPPQWMSDRGVTACSAVIK